VSPNLFRNQTLAAVLGHIEFQSIFHLIRVSPYDQKICEARKYPKGHPIYEENKCSIPSFSPNACFYHKRSLDTVKDLTGYIYLDFDGILSSAIFTQLPFVYACWLSFGGRGYGVLIKVEGLTLENFTEVWLYLEDYFLKNFSLKIDPQTKDYSRQTVLSSDPNIHVNPSVVPLNVNAIDLSPFKTFTYEDFSLSPDLFNLSDNYSSTTEKFYQKIIYKTTLDDYEGKPYIIIPEGKLYKNAYIPRIVKDGKRHTWLSGYAYSLLFNNDKISYSSLTNILMKVNTQHCQPPLEYKDIKQMVNSFMKRRSNKTLKIYAKKKRIWFDPESGMSLHDKQVIVGTVNGRFRRERTLTELTEIYKELKIAFGKVTQPMLQDHSEYSIRTIKTYWHDIIQGAG